MFWAFAQGASNSILKDLEMAKASQQEMDTWKKRIEIQQQLMDQAEAAKAKNRIVNTFEDMNTGKLVETTASGETREVALPANYVEGRKQQAALLAEQARLEAERDTRKFESTLSKDQAAVESSRARAAASRASAGLAPLRAEQIRAETDKARRQDTANGEKPPTTAEKRQQAAAAASVSDSIINRAAAIEDAGLKELIEEARREALEETDVVARLQKLREVEALVAANSSAAYNSNNSTY